MNPFDQYLVDIYAGREKPSSGPWLFEIDGVEVGSLSLATVNGSEFFCWFWPNAEYEPFKADFDAWISESQKLAISKPAFAKQGEGFVHVGDGFQRDEALLNRLIHCRCGVRDQLTNKSILRAHIPSIWKDKAWFRPGFKRPFVTFPSPDAKMFESARFEERISIWRLKRNQKILGVIELIEVDQPTFFCGFRPGPDFESFRYLFEEQELLKYDRYSSEEAKNAVEAIEVQISQLELEPANAETESISFRSLSIDGPKALFRPIFRNNRTK